MSTCKHIHTSINRFKEDITNAWWKQVVCLDCNHVLSVEPETLPLKIGKVKP